MKRGIAILLLLTAVLSLCACGQSAAPTAPAAEPAAAPAADQTPVPAPERSPSPEELVYREAERLLFVEPDHDRAFALLKDYEDSDDLPLVTLLGECYWQGYGTAMDDSKAYELFSRGAEQGYPFAMYYVGASVYHGYGVPADPEKGRELLKEAVAAELKAAEETADEVEKGRYYYHYGYDTIFFLSETEEEQKEAFPYLEKAAAYGNPTAEFWMGLIYKGISIDGLLYRPEPDKEKGEAYLTAAQQHGNAEAAKFIGK